MAVHTLSKSLVATVTTIVALTAVGNSGYAAPEELNGFDLTDCTINADQIKRGGPPKDGIPALTEPATISNEKASYLNDEDKVIGVQINGKARAYPVRILNHHENVNDVLGDKPIAVTYCPLCHSAIVFNRKVGGEVREFGISGLLWNSNVLLYDRKENGRSSLWSQVAMRAVCGPAAKKGLKLNVLSSHLVRWDRWCKQHTETSVLAPDTGYRRDYARNPYKRYFSTQQLMFPVTASRNELTDYPNKEQLIVVRSGDHIKGYPFSELAAATDANGTVKDTVGDTQIQLTYRSQTETATASLAEKHLPEKDLGVAYMFWFAWKSVYPEADLFKATD